MARKATMENLEKAVEDSTARVSDLVKQLEDAKARQKEAVIKVRERKKELEQENNNGLAAVIKEVFGDDITPDGFEKEMNELLLINEVKEYIESEREKRKVAPKDEIEEKAQNDSMVPENNLIAQNP